MGGNIMEETKQAYLKSRGEGKPLFFFTPEVIQGLKTRRCLNCFKVLQTENDYCSRKCYLEKVTK
jgi:hypothetical protein